MFVKAIERLARSMAAQKLEPDYIKYYLMETYQLDATKAAELLERLGIGKGGKGKADKGGGRSPMKPGSDSGKRSSFF